jgi:hypothetical protein
MDQFLFAVGAFIVLIFLATILRRRRATVIQSPTLGILDLSAGSSVAMINADRAAIGQFFSSVLESSGTPPTCNVLFVYCDIEPDGSIRHCNSGLREIIRDSGAVVVVVASENPGSGYVAAAKRKPGYGHANLVMTTDRRGAVFPVFFQRLFTHMKRGVSMPVAWVKLCPQIPGLQQTDCPAYVFVCEAGQVVFR